MDPNSLVMLMAEASEAMINLADLGDRLIVGDSDEKFQEIYLVRVAASSRLAKLALVMEIQDHKLTSSIVHLAKLVLMGFRSIDDIRSDAKSLIDLSFEPGVMQA